MNTLLTDETRFVTDSGRVLFGSCLEPFPFCGKTLTCQGRLLRIRYARKKKEPVSS